jgi:hypothetical protein
VQRKGKKIPRLIFSPQKTAAFSSYQGKVIHNLGARCADFAQYSSDFDLQGSFYCEKNGDF